MERGEYQTGEGRRYFHVHWEDPDDQFADLVSGAPATGIALYDGKWIQIHLASLPEDFPLKAQHRTNQCNYWFEDFPVEPQE